MPVKIDPKLREGVHIRLGYTVPTGKKTRGGEDGTRPVQSKTFVFSAAIRRHLDNLAEIYGGEVIEWEDGKALGQPWRVITESSTIRILIAPVKGAFSQFFEMWSAGGCARRCDNETELLTKQPCLCPAEGLERQKMAAKGEACKLTTRFVVMLPELDELVGARLETKSYWAGLELMGNELIFRAAFENGLFLPGELRIPEPRVKVRDGKTTRYTVVELDVPMSKAAQALGMAGPEFQAAGALPAAPAQDPAPREPVKEATATARASAPVASDTAAPSQPVDRSVRQRAIGEALVKACLGSEGAAGDVVWLVTGGRTHNVSHLNDDESERAIRLAEAIDAGRLSVGYGIGGSDEPLWINGDDEPVDVVWNGNEIADIVPTAAGSPGTRWKRAISGTGITQASLLRQAAIIAGELGTEAPRNLEQLVDGELNRRLEGWLDERKNAMASA